MQSGKCKLKPWSESRKQLTRKASKIVGKENSHHCWWEGKLTQQSGNRYGESSEN